MGFHGLSFGSLLLIIFLAVLLFGTKRLRTMGEDLGAAFRSFRKGLQQEESTDATKPDINHKIKNPEDPHA